MLQEAQIFHAAHGEATHLQLLNNAENAVSMTENFVLQTMDQDHPILHAASGQRSGKR